MTRQEKLREHLEKIKEIKIRLKLIQEEWSAYNKSFNEWIQKELGVQNHNGELHLTEILEKWDDKRDIASQP